MVERAEFTLNQYTEVRIRFGCDTTSLSNWGKTEPEEHVVNIEAVFLSDNFSKLWYFILVVWIEGFINFWQIRIQLIGIIFIIASKILLHPSLIEERVWPIQWIRKRLEIHHTQCLKCFKDIPVWVPPKLYASIIIANLFRVEHHDVWSSGEFSLGLHWSLARHAKGSILIIIDNRNSNWSTYLVAASSHRWNRVDTPHVLSNGTS